MFGWVRRRRVLGMWAMLVLAALSPVPGHSGAPGAATSEVVIVSESGEHRFGVEVARTPQEQARGLMYRRRLEPDAGMLFEYGRPRTSPCGCATPTFRST